MFRSKFLGNTHVPHRKGTAASAPVRMTAPEEVILPLSQHIGAPASLVVKVGDEVKVGQLIAEASGYVSSPIYSSVSGKVTKIDSVLFSNGKSSGAIRIASDGLMTVYEGVTPPTITDTESFSSAIQASGIVGLGGAGFPTSVKLDGISKNNVDTLIINGAECEPYITVDARTMVDDSVYVFEGISLIKSYYPSIKRVVFGIESNKPECIEEIARIFADDESVSIIPLPTLYPQGAEKVLIYNTVGKVVPEGKLPHDVGVCVMNVTTVATIAKYVKTGMPLVEKCISVDGGAVSEPKNVIAPIGTPIKDVIAFAGGLSDTAGKIIIGGPMTGFAACSTDEPIVKTTSAIIVLTQKEARANASTPCIHCGRCVESCPALLNPTLFSRALNDDNQDERMAKLEDGHINLCVECGSCSFVCPAKRPLLENIRVAKNSLREYKAHKATLK